MVFGELLRVFQAYFRVVCKDVFVCRPEKKVFVIFNNGGDETCTQYTHTHAWTLCLIYF